MTDEETNQVVAGAVRAVLASIPHFAHQAEHVTASVAKRMADDPTVAELFLVRVGDGVEVVDAEPDMGLRLMHLPIARWRAAVPGAVRGTDTAH